jgi:hypothetical protein
MAIIVALVSTLLMAALGAALVLSTISETLVAAGFRGALEGRYAADAALERALDDLAASPDWNAVLGGVTRSGFADGLPGVRRLPDGSDLDLHRIRNLLNCRQVVSCTASDLAAHSTERPWGANNPEWQLFAHGPVAALSPASSIDSSQYVVVLVADDPAENDDDPRIDGDSDSNPGSRKIRLRAEAFGPRGGHQVIEAAVSRPDAAAEGVRVIAWGLVR